MVREAFSDGQIVLEPGPTPLRSRMAGEPYAPAASTIEDAWSGPRLVSSVLDGMSIRSASVSAAMVRFGRSRASSRYAKAAFQRTVPTALTGWTIAPSALANARCQGESSSSSMRRTSSVRSARSR